MNRAKAWKVWRCHWQRCAKKILSVVCGHLTASDNKCSRNPIQSESKFKSESNTIVCSELQAASEPLGGGNLYLAENIKYLREQKGLNQRDFSAELGLSQSAVGNWESKTRIPDIETIIKIAGFFEVSLDDLILCEMKPTIPLHVTNIKYLRKKHEMTQDDMATLLELSNKSQYHKRENADLEFKVNEIEKLADFFGMTLDQLVKQDLRGGA